MCSSDLCRIERLAREAGYELGFGGVSGNGTALGLGRVPVYAWDTGLVPLGLRDDGFGALGRLFHPGRDPMGLLMTIGIGIAAVIIAGLVIGHHGIWTFLIAVVIGIVLVALVGRLLANRGATRTV